MELPSCGKCELGKMIPLSDYGPDGSAVIFKAWVCTRCKFALRIDKGDISYSEVGEQRPEKHHGRQ